MRRAALLAILLACLPGAQRASAETPAGHLWIGRDVADCVQADLELLQETHPNGAALQTVTELCYNALLAQVNVEAQQVRRDAYMFQKWENIALMAMVIAITISGVALAGFQLRTAYRLAESSKKPVQGLDRGGVSLEPHRFSVQSSVVGVTILAISLAFFIVFVLYVYRITDAAPPAPVPPAPVLPAPVLPATGVAPPAYNLSATPQPEGGSK